MRFIQKLFLGILFLLSGVVSYAQQATVSGIVTDPMGDALSDVHVYISEHRWAVTDSLGKFLIKKVDTGSQTVKISRIGYMPYSRMIEIKPNDDIFLKVLLDERVYSNKTVVVTASRTSKELEDVSVPVSVVDQEEIEMSGNLRLSDVLSEQLGLNLVSNHGTGIQLQGFNPEYTLILIDNQPVIGRSAGTLDLTRLAVGDIKQIEMVKGPSSALWGSDALAGVINIITDKGKRPVSWEMNSQYGNYNTYDFSNNLSFRNEKFRSRFFLNTNGSDGYDLNPATITPTIPQYANYTASGGFSYRFNPTVEVRLNGRYYKEDQSYVSGYNYLNESTIRLADGRQDQSDFNINPELVLSFGNRQLLEATAFISGFDSETEEIYQDDGSQYYYEKYVQKLRKYEIKSSTFWNDENTTVFGGGYNVEDLNAEIYADIPEFSSQFIYAQHEISLSEKLSLTSGFRFDNHSKYQSQISPKFSALYKVNDILTLRGSWGMGFKAPDFSQLFLNFTNPIAGYSVFGSSTVVDGIERLQNDGQIKEMYYDPSLITDIEAEHSSAFNVGFEIIPQDGIQLRVNAFRNNVRDLIETQRIALKTNNQSVFSYINLNRIYTQGLELELRYSPDFAKGLNISTGFQYLDARRQISKEYDDVVDGKVVTVTRTSYETMFNRSKYTSNFKVFYTHEPSGLEYSFRVQYRGKYGFSDRNQNLIVDSDEYAEPISIINTSLAKTFYERYKLMIGVKNLNDFTNETELPSNPGRTYYVQLNIKLY